MTSIGLISDVHATPAPIEEALSIFKRAGVEQALCAVPFKSPNHLRDTGRG